MRSELDAINQVELAALLRDVLRAAHDAKDHRLGLYVARRMRVALALLDESVILGVGPRHYVSGQP